MGWFGKKKEADGGDYVDMEQQQNLPIAVAVVAEQVRQQSPPRTTAASPIYSRSPATSVMTSSSSNKPFFQALPRVPTVIPMCPHCHQVNCTTRIRTAPNWITCTVAIVLLFVFWPVFWIPFVTDSMKRTDHYCQYCQNHVGSVHPFADCCVKHRA